MRGAGREADVLADHLTELSLRGVAKEGRLRAAGSLVLGWQGGAEPANGRGHQASPQEACSTPQTQRHFPLLATTFPESAEATQILEIMTRSGSNLLNSNFWAFQHTQLLSNWYSPPEHKWLIRHDPLIRRVSLSLITVSFCD